MANPHPFHVLQDIGLSEKAASLYLTLLSRKKMTVAELARESGVKRATCYEYLDQLLKKGFLVRNPVGKRIFYSPVEPKRVLSSFRKKVDLLERSVEEMTMLHENAISKPKVSYYEGKTEIKSIYEDLFTTMGDVYSIFPAAAFFENFSEEEYSEFDKAISDHALKSKDLFVRDKYVNKIKEIRARNGNPNQLDKVLPKDFTCNVDVLIYAEKVALVSLRDLSAIVIENKDIAELFKSMHNLVWRSI